jgi:hypothetical protein
MRRPVMRRVEACIESHWGHFEHSFSCSSLSKLFPDSRRCGFFFLVVVYATLAQCLFTFHLRHLRWYSEL